ncbi:hypothetical protein GIB67_006501 [Kingdonia uniflora]|uniref:Uncharacterized protein n=1 Tax=Kingdonia uniflora TaxID=39325 RepID=A0A7J7LEH7_9MAGN|nr:hypothetical protein GIB67_006501 [Kingdonia uniflora]
MENQQQSWKLRFSFKNATIIVCFFNFITVLLLLQGVFSGLSNARNNPQQARLRFIRESEEMRRAMEPLELIKRVNQIKQEAYVEPEVVLQKVSKQTAAADLSKRLNNMRNEGNSQKAIEEWRKRKMERAKLRGLVKNGTVTTQA